MASTYSPGGTGSSCRCSTAATCVATATPTKRPIRRRRARPWTASRPCSRTSTSLWRGSGGRAQTVVADAPGKAAVGAEEAGGCQEEETPPSRPEPPLRAVDRPQDRVDPSPVAVEVGEPGLGGAPVVLA